MLENCQVLFASKEIEDLLFDEFSKKEKRKVCIKPECTRFGKKLPSDIELIIPNNVGDPSFGMTSFEIDDEMLPEPGKFRKLLVTNQDGSSDFFLLSHAGQVDSSSKKFENEFKRCTNLIQNAECQNCLIVNNFELYGEEICKKHNLTYCFIGLGHANGQLVITAITSEGKIGKLNGIECKTGIFKNLTTTDEFKKIANDLSKKEFDVLIAVHYDNPKFTK